MSYALELTDPAIDDLKHLDIWLQEETLDELERLAVTPPARRRRVGDLVHDFVRRKGTEVFYVFVTVRVDEVARAIRVKSIATYVRDES